MVDFLPIHKLPISALQRFTAGVCIRQLFEVLLKEKLIFFYWFIITENLLSSCLLSYFRQSPSGLSYVIYSRVAFIQPNHHAGLTECCCDCSCICLRFVLNKTEALLLFLFTSFLQRDDFMKSAGDPQFILCYSHRSFYLCVWRQEIFTAGCVILCNNRTVLWTLITGTFVSLLQSGDGGRWCCFCGKSQTDVCALLRGLPCILCLMINMCESCGRMSLCTLTPSAVPVKCLSSVSTSNLLFG